MADDGERPPSPPQPRRLSRREKGKAKVGEPTDYSSDDDQSHRESPVPCSSNNPTDFVSDDDQSHRDSPVPGSRNNLIDFFSLDDQAHIDPPVPGSSNNPIELDSDDDQAHRDSPMPDSRTNASGDREMEVVRVPINPRPRPIFMTEEICLKLKVSSVEVLGPHAKLNLSFHEAFLLTGCNDILNHPPIRFSRDLILFDATDRRYDMNISNHECAALSRFHMNSEWQEFVLAAQIRERDELLFFRFSDDVAGHVYYRLEFIKVPESQPPISYNPSADDEDCCLEKNLTPLSVDPVNPVLYLDNEEAYDLTGCEELQRPPSASCSKTLQVNDDFDRTFNLRLLPYIANKAWAGYFISGDWRDFVIANNLEARDKILFYVHYVVANNSDSYFYNVKVIRNKPQLAEVEAGNEEEPIEYNAEPSVLPDYDAACLFRTLSGYEVVHDGGKPRLFLDASGASILFDCENIQDEYPAGKLRENLTVFDSNYRQYDMLLSNFELSSGEVHYAVDAGWQRFVKDHNLRTGDQVSFHRFAGEKGLKKTFVLRYIRNNSSGSGDGGSGSGHEEED